MDLLTTLLGLDWLNISGWAVAIALIFYILRKFTHATKPWLTWQQHLTISAGEAKLSDERKAASDTKDKLIEEQSSTIATQATTLGVVDDFLRKVPVRGPHPGDTGAQAELTGTEVS